MLPLTLGWPNDCNKCGKRYFLRHWYKVSQIMMLETVGQKEKEDQDEIQKVKELKKQEKLKKLGKISLQAVEGQSLNCRSMGTINPKPLLWTMGITIPSWMLSGKMVWCAISGSTPLKVQSNQQTENSEPIYPWTQLDNTEKYGSNSSSTC